ncbi:GNAT family N-acetyltransferase [Microterricola viridarii]|uniref:[SSU ribosomal protein S5P]-alanine acetyltransferase n=1 Tax=Microterricola viridarii TaxID=412690 RepID=A0A1H1NC95_9MICO|nr:GNAT family N-acetyltransferase [Microterricola viridarii]SDR96586.1 [SSU ribosomal protein S5P]-alanine acetyltransferase [Microterricola viridarii]
MPTSANLPRALPDGTALRLLRADDSAALTRAYLRNRAHLAPWEPVRSEDYFTPAGQRSVVLGQLGQYGAGTGFPLVLSDGAEILARINLSGIARGPFQSASLGYWVDGEYTGRGIAQAMLQHVVELARDRLQLHRLEAGTLLHNAASQAVLARAGFERIGVAPRYLKIAGDWQDHVLFQRILHD